MQGSFELEGETIVELDDMGDESIVLSQVTESGDLHRVVLEWPQLIQAVEVLRPRYEPKNTERPAELAA
ncbi:hypothetical protein SAMN06295987_102603 [Novosphingobium mathurense]|uniref:Uncharacterized protein n=1 Tax=Novosphingobium mathurense TaxID=428990 RepID=A0A1U6HK36_9SPHN|nr:hypothetical protein SAMN06295987_102603 [Novosphingobium mathurense]